MIKEYYKVSKILKGGKINKRVMFCVRVPRIIDNRQKRYYFDTEDKAIVFSKLMKKKGDKITNDAYKPKTEKNQYKKVVMLEIYSSRLMNHFNMLDDQYIHLFKAIDEAIEQKDDKIFNEFGFYEINQNDLKNE
jgi:hypothetical protein